MVAITIFFTIMLMIWRPRGLAIGYTTLTETILTLATSVITLATIHATWPIMVNATLTLLVLIAFALILEAAGLYRWIALHLLRRGQGKGVLLFLQVMLLGAVVSLLLTNQGAALIATSVVVEISLVLGFGSEATFAFVMATGLIADVASLPFTSSNLVNLITANYAHISFGRYALVMLPISLVAIASSVFVLFFYFWPDIPTTYRLDKRIKLDKEDERDQKSFVIKSLIKTPWQVVIFSLAIWLIVINLDKVGLTTLLVYLWQNLAKWGFSLAIIGTGFLSTLLCAITNNIPIAPINTQAIQAITDINPAIREAMVYASVIGCTIGAKISPIGSLSTLLWFHVLARKGIRISWLKYFQISMALVLPVVFIALLSLAIWLPGLISPS